MNVLLTGATGFMGHHLHKALTAAGHHVRCAVSARALARMPEAIEVDFARDTRAEVWQARLAGIDAVINAVGVLRNSRARPIDAVHRETPIALFDACIERQVKQVVQISALGIENNPTRYACTKRAADGHLLALAAGGHIQASVLRPSIVFGRGGASSGLFMMLARLPRLCLPGPVLSTKVQPLAVTDLAAAVVTLLRSSAPPQGVLPVVGPAPLPLADFIASLREQLGHAPAKVVRLPNLLTQASARLGDWLPILPWCSETLALLGQDNVADAAVLSALLGREALHYRDFVQAVWNQ